MRRPKLATEFLLRFLVVFVTVLIPWHGLYGAFGGYFRACGNTFFGSLFDDAVVEFNEIENGVDGRDIELWLENTRTPFAADTQGSSRWLGYLPTAFSLSLILATPLPWRRLGLALLIWLPLIHIYVGFRTLVLLWTVFSVEGPLALFSPSPAVSRVLEFLNWMLVVSFAGSFVLPVFIWFACCFRRSNLTLLGKRIGVDFNSAVPAEA